MAERTMAGFDDTYTIYWGAERRQNYRRNKMRTLFLTLLASALTLCFGSAQAQEVCLDGNTATGIDDLEVFTDQGGTQVFDVVFRLATGFNTYGQNLDGFPFEGGNAEEDAFATILAINNALDTTSANSAGVSNRDIYYIGVEEEQQGSAGAIAAVGGEYIASAAWEACQTDCLAGTTILEADQQHVYADLTPPDGNVCGGSPPGPAFSITPGITGSWFGGPPRDGEGYSIEVLGSGNDLRMLVYFYTYDDDGNQMWLIGVADINGDTDTITIPVLVSSGPVFGPNYNPDDVVFEDWGTLTFTFSSCDAGTAEYDSDIGFGSGSFDIIRLSSIATLSCP
jgi:hypothetical protein